MQGAYVHSSCINSMLCLDNQLPRHCWNNNSKSIKRAENYYLSSLTLHEKRLEKHRLFQEEFDETVTCMVVVRPLPANRV